MYTTQKALAYSWNLSTTIVPVSVAEVRSYQGIKNEQFHSKCPAGTFLEQIGPKNRSWARLTKSSKKHKCLKEFYCFQERQ